MTGRGSARSRHGYWPDETSLDSFLVFVYRSREYIKASLHRLCNLFATGSRLEKKPEKVAERFS